MPGSKHTDRVRRLAQRIRDEDDEITEQHLHLDNLPPGTKIDTDATGRLKAISIPDDDRVTPTDPGRKPISVAPKSGFQGLLATSGGVVVKVVSAVNNPYALGALALLVAAFIAWLRLRR